MDPPKEDFIHFGPVASALYAAPRPGSPSTPKTPAKLRGYGDCLELVEDDLGDNHHYTRRSLHLPAESRRPVRTPCPHCGLSGW